MRYILLLTLILITVHSGYADDDIIRPSDFVRTGPRYRYSLINWFLGYPYRVADPATNPPVADSVVDFVDSFLASSAGATRDWQDGRVNVRFKGAPSPYAYREAQESWGYARSIPTVVYELWSKEKLQVFIEANSKAVLDYWGHWVCERNDMETQHLTRAAALSESQVFAKVVPILEHHDLSITPEDYHIFVWSEFCGMAHFQNNQHAEPGAPTAFRNSTWVVHTAANDADTDRIIMQLTRCSGRLIYLRYLPSPERIQQWYDYQHTGKGQ